MTQAPVRKAAFKAVSQIAIHYRESPLSRNLGSVAKGAPQGGDRFPWLRLQFEPDGPVEDLFERLDDTRFNVLVVGQPAPEAERLGVGDLVRVHSIPAGGDNAQVLARASIGMPAFYLLRPDGHVGLAGTDLDLTAVRRWFADSHVHITQELHDA